MILWLAQSGYRLGIFPELPGWIICSPPRVNKIYPIFKLNSKSQVLIGTLWLNRLQFIDPVPTHLMIDTLLLVGNSVLGQTNFSLATDLTRVQWPKRSLKTHYPLEGCGDSVSNERNSLFQVFQSGFRAHCSTDTTLLSMLVLLDPSAAFVTVHRSILWQRLDSWLFLYLFL